MAGNILAQAVVEGDDTWRLFAPFELVWAGGRIGRAAMQVYYWWFNARERFEAQAARQREQEYRRVAELAALRAGEERADGEAQLGAVVPREQLPEEPALTDLPVDTVIARETVRPAADSDHADELAKAPDDGRRFVRPRLPEVSFVEEEDRAQERPAERARTKRTF